MYKIAELISAGIILKPEQKEDSPEVQDSSVNFDGQQA